ncbi:GATOR complex protein Iml1 isoform X3 [Lutzomyia longipalpis]|uniref:GATOR complex protein Iml1 isoform X3 n=1 Tax=Lutzomyia longipalpis TaxID=7200 RepID=UPI002483AF10|nr:GATOR complex protein Iml1 isoform X3 [Lutzomyia longipalpis]
MKLFKLHTHQKSNNSADLLLHPKEHPDLKLGDIVEIYHPEDEGCRLLLQVTTFYEEFQGRETISVETNIATTFNLRIYADIVIHRVDPDAVALDSVEITFKDQYMGRSEMWRLKSHLVNTCVYINKKIEYCEGSIRCQVYEMWAQGDRVACGNITADTKVVFRSSTSMVYLFIQMSSEMWDFDIHGDLYFEKAVNGFLTDLFMKWKKLGCNHEVTIVLFSRTFYAAKSLDEFPAHMRECLQMDYKGRFYEDFYRVAIQNERNDDWSTILVELRRLFTGYQNTVLKYHERPDIAIPPATNSTAAQGNFLEVLNISLNVFEKHYLDRSFDRTGQLSVVITPGVGVFEVDRELTNITKQRIIDNGVGSDLVCVGEQPLHAVPLLKFHNKDSSLNADDYSMPHWINLSFYSTNKKVAYSTFIPRIKLPPLRPDADTDVDQENQILKFLPDNHTEYIHNSLFDYDAYDAQIFQMPPAHGTCSLQRPPRTKKTSVPSLEGYLASANNEWLSTSPRQILRRKMSDPDIHHGGNSVLSNLSQVDSPTSANLSESFKAIEKANRKGFIGNGSVIRPGRALINPFDPSHVTIKLTSNRRRWTHIFPKGPTGVLIQQHHYQAVPTTKTCESAYNEVDASDYAHTATCSIAESLDDYAGIESVSESGGDVGTPRRKISMLHSAAGHSVTVTPSKSLTLLWGATGEQEWTPALTTGVDWKSLTIPACLPITTDYFPDKRSLHNDYVVSDYTLLPEDVYADYATNRAVSQKPLTTEQVFKELISQRLAQGFQLIVLPDTIKQKPSSAPCCGGIQMPKYFVLGTPPQEATKEHLLSIGRMFHRISLSGSVITVTRYRPRHPYPPITVDYRYRFHAPQHDTYEVSGVNFTTEKLENYNWNFMDQYICTRGDTDFMLHENLKYWRYRMYLLPKDHPAMKKILDGLTTKCDIFTEIQSDSPKQQIEDFLHYVEMHLNRIKRVQCKKPRLLLQGSPTSQQSHLTRRRHSTSIISRPANQGLGNSPFRDRVGSNRLPERARPRLSGKSLAAGRAVQEATGMVGVPGDSLSIDDSDESLAVEIKFKVTDPLMDIYKAMKHPTTGVPFIGPAQSMPSCTFVSYDALKWLQDRIEGPFDAVEMLERMRREKLICHASGDFSKPIIVGFVLYYITKQEKDVVLPLENLKAFENEWMEVEVVTPEMKQMSIHPHEVNVPEFLRESIGSVFSEAPLYKQSHLEIDINNKSDRIEWGHARYHRVMIPGHAFEIVAQWVIASGPIVYDLIYGWSRKATQCGFQLVAIPADPLAEPFTEKSDPLRGPIFIPLDTECLKQKRDFLFEEFKKDTWATRLLLFQEAILARFGFMPCAVETKAGSNQASLDFQYVHCSGNMFVLVPSPHQGLRSRQRLASGGSQKKPNFVKHYPVTTDTQSPHEAYITRHVSGKNKDDMDTIRKTGFLWSWNHMVPNKKWKSLVINNSPDGEIIQLRMLRDFKNFCTNQDQRLIAFWDHCWELKEKASTQTTSE